jgi:proline racemase
MVVTRRLSLTPLSLPCPRRATSSTKVQLPKGERRAAITVANLLWITGFAQYVVDPDDPLPNGFTVGDLWGRAAD